VDGRTDRLDINDETKYSLSTIFAAISKMYEKRRFRQLLCEQKSEPGNYRLLPTAMLDCWGLCVVNRRALQGYTSKQRSIHDLPVGMHRRVWRTKSVRKTRRIMQKCWSSEPSAGYTSLLHMVIAVKVASPCTPWRSDDSNSIYSRPSVLKGCAAGFVRCAAEFLMLYHCA
jgi:hypothetical protein